MQTTQPKQAKRRLKPSDVLQRFLAFFLSSFALFLWTLFLVAASCLGEKVTLRRFVFPAVSRSPTVDFISVTLWWFAIVQHNDTSLVYFSQYYFLSRRCFGAAVVNRQHRQQFSINHRVNFINDHKKFSENKVLYLVLTNRAGGLYARILTEVVSTDRTQWGL